MTSKGTLVTFGTEETFGRDGLTKLGLVVWINREDLKKILEEKP